MQHQDYELSVLINGRPIKKYGHNGLSFVEGRKNTVYTIKFKNNTPSQVLAIISVDGLCVVDGKPAMADSRGYIVPAYSPVEIKGWRISEDRSSDFVFSDKPTAYSTQSQGQDINCGVVSVKVIAEKVRPAIWIYSTYNTPPPVEEHHHHYHPVRPIYPVYHPPHCWWGDSPMCSGFNSGGIVRSVETSKNQGCCFMNSVSNQSLSEMNEGSQSVQTAYLVPSQDNPDFNLGTGWGKEKEDRVTMKDFERNGEICTISIFYTDAEGLKKVGIDTTEKPAITKVPLPQGFGGFCVPPKLTAGS